MQHRSNDREGSNESQETPGLWPGVFRSGERAEPALRGLLHDTANWLTIAVGHLSLLQEELESPRAHDRLQRAQRALEACQQLHELFLGRVPVATDPAPARVLLERVRDGFEPRLAEGRPRDETVELIVTGDGESRAAVPPVLLINAVGNLLNNALEAMEGAGRVELRVESGDGRLRVLVVDDGPGMPEETARQCTREGFSTKAGPGRGLGLARIVHTLAPWGGRLEISSEPGTGTRAVLDLPLQETAQGTRDEAVILVVEDDPDVRELLGEMCDAAGRSAETVGTAEEALRAFRPGVHRAAILDQGLPDLPGLDLAKRIRQADPAVGIVLLSGDRRVLEPGALDPSVDRGVLKPVALGPFRQLLREVLQLRDERSDSLSSSGPSAAHAEG